MLLLLWLLLWLWLLLLPLRPMLLEEVVAAFMLLSYLLFDVVVR